MSNIKTRYEIPRWVPYHYRGLYSIRVLATVLVVIFTPVLLAFVVAYHQYEAGVANSWLITASGWWMVILATTFILYMPVMSWVAELYLRRVWFRATKCKMPKGPGWTEHHLSRYKEMLRKLTRLAHWANDERRVENFRRARAVVAVILWQDSLPWCTCCPERVPDIRALKKLASSS